MYCNTVKYMSNVKNDIENLTGKILLATPAISNEYLNKALDYYLFFTFAKKREQMNS